MECKDFKKLLSQFLDNQLEKKEQNEMQGHLQTCVRCKSELESLSKMINLMKGLKEINPPLDFVEKVNRRLERATFWQKIKQGLGILWPIKIPVQVVTVAATLVLAIYIANQLETTSYREKKTQEVVKKQVIQEENVKKRKESLPSALSGSLATKEAKLAKNEKEDMFYAGKYQYQDKIVEENNLNMACKDNVCAISSETEAELEKFKSKDKPLLAVGEKAEGRVLSAKGEEQKIGEVKEVDKIEETESRTKVTLSGKETIFLKETKQNWILEAVDWNLNKEKLQKLLKEFEVIDLSRKRYKENKKSGLIFTFKIRFGYLSTFFSRLKELGELEAVTEFPVPRTEAYIGPRGSINPRVLEELISITLTLLRR